MPRALTAFNLVFHTQIFLRTYGGITYVKSLNCSLRCFLLTFMCMSKRTKSSITNLNTILAVVSLCPFLTSATFKIRYFAQVVVDTKSCNGTWVRVLKMQTAEVALGHWVWQNQSLSSRSSILHLLSTNKGSSPSLSKQLRVPSQQWLSQGISNEIKHHASICRLSCCRTTLFHF